MNVNDGANAIPITWRVKLDKMNCNNLAIKIAY